MAGWPYTTQRWKRLRLSKLCTQPLCEHCQRDGLLVMATVVDHVKPIKHGGDPFPAIEELAALCASCHGAKTARGVEAGAIKTTRRRIRRGCTTSGLPACPNHPWNGEKSLGADRLNTDPSLPSQLVSFLEQWDG